jgi:plasmid stabilization system protein ParE
MASKPPRLSVSLTPRAGHDLDEIWAWNAEDRSPEHADAYDVFLLQRSASLMAIYTVLLPSE